MLLLVPKLAVKPGNSLWKFEPNADALAHAAQVHAHRADADQPNTDQLNGNDVPLAASNAAAVPTGPGAYLETASTPINGTWVT